jgi:tetratricopeptide (TPR) repeat protein
VFYGNTFIYSPEKQTVDLRVGTSGALKVFLNDELMVACFDENNNGYDTYSVRTTLQKGWNRLLIKCGYSEITQCNFAVRLTDPQGQPIPNLEISTAPQTYNSKPGAEKLNIPNFAEAFFRKKIEEHPDYLENYLLLAECYALNDKAVESELILRDALKRAPENAMIYLHLIEAYQRGEKYDEVNTAFEKIYRLDPKIPVVLEHRISEALENQDYDEASVLLDKLAVLIPDSPNLQQQYIVYYSKRSLPDKMIETVHAAYEKFPENWNIVQTEAIVESMVKQDQKQGIPIIRKYLKKHTVQDVFLHLAEYYQNTGDF